jgi:hypothetical protein
LLNGRSYESKHTVPYGIPAQNCSYDREYAKKRLSERAIGSTILAHYDPSDPSLSALELEEYGVGSMASLFFWLLVAGFSLYFGFRNLSGKPLAPTVQKVVPPTTGP